MDTPAAVVVTVTPGPPAVIYVALSPPFAMRARSWSPSASFLSFNIFFAAHSRSSCPPHRLAMMPSCHVYGGRRKTANRRPPPPLMRGPSWWTRHKKETILKKCVWRTADFSPNTLRAMGIGPSGLTTKNDTCILRRVGLCWRRASQPPPTYSICGNRIARARRLLPVLSKPTRPPFAGMCCFSFLLALVSLVDLMRLANASRRGIVRVCFCSLVAQLLL